MVFVLLEFVKIVHPILSLITINVTVILLLKSLLALLDCPANCTTCTSNTTCTACKSTYGLQNGECLHCPAGTYLQGQTCQRKIILQKIYLKLSLPTILQNMHEWNSMPNMRAWLCFPSRSDSLPNLSL